MESDEYSETFESVNSESGSKQIRTDGTRRSDENSVAATDITTTDTASCIDTEFTSPHASARHLPKERVPVRRSLSLSSIKTAHSLTSTDCSTLRFSRHFSEPDKDASEDDRDDVDAADADAYSSSFDSFSSDEEDADELSDDDASKKSYSSNSFQSDSERTADVDVMSVKSRVEVDSRDLPVEIDHSAASRDSTPENRLSPFGLLYLDQDSLDSLEVDNELAVGIDTTRHEPVATENSVEQKVTAELVPGLDDVEASEFIKNQLRRLKQSVNVTKKNERLSSKHNKLRSMAAESWNYGELNDFFRSKIDHMWKSNDQDVLPVQTETSYHTGSCRILSNYGEKLKRDSGFSQSVVVRLRMQNTLNRIEKASHVHDRSLCESCCKEDEMLAMKDFLRAKRAVATEKLTNERLDQHLILTDPLTQLGETLHFMAQYRGRPDLVMEHLLRPLTDAGNEHDGELSQAS